MERGKRGKAMTKKGKLLVKKINTLFDSFGPLMPASKGMKYIRPGAGGRRQVGKKGLLSRVHEIIGGIAPSDLARLQRSIERDGVLMPVVVSKATGEIIDGKHRAKLAKKYPIIELNVDEREAARQAVVLNTARRHYVPEQMKELIGLFRKEGFTQQEVAEMVGVTRPRISQIENAPIVNSNNAVKVIADQDETSLEQKVDLRYKTGKKEKNDNKAEKKTELQKEEAIEAPSLIIDWPEILKQLLGFEADAAAHLGLVKMAVEGKSEQGDLGHIVAAIEILRQIQNLWAESKILYECEAGGLLNKFKVPGKNGSSKKGDAN